MPPSYQPSTCCQFTIIESQIHQGQRSFKIQCYDSKVSLPIELIHNFDVAREQNKYSKNVLQNARIQKRSYDLSYGKFQEKQLFWTFLEFLVTESSLGLDWICNNGVKKTVKLSPINLRHPSSVFRTKVVKNTPEARGIIRSHLSVRNSHHVIGLV